jgi:protein-disulfide isomerase
MSSREAVDRLYLEVFYMVQMLKFPGILGAAIAVTMLASASAKATAGQGGPVAQAPQPQVPPAPALTPQQMNEEMLKELRAIRMLLEKISTPQPSGPPPQPQTGRVTNLTGYALGRPDAPLTMVEFTDLQCPFCRQFAITSFDEIKKNWIDTGKLRYLSRDFPLDFHAQAMPAARAARCAGEQGKFWEMRMGLMRNANLLTAAYITKTSSDLKVEPKAFETCVASTKFDAEIQAEMAEGTRLGVTGTPTFVMGKTTATAIEGPVMVGALPYAMFDAKLKALLGPDSK